MKPELAMPDNMIMAYGGTIIMRRLRDSYHLLGLANIMAKETCLLWLTHNVLVYELSCGVLAWYLATFWLRTKKNPFY
jgi:hypothetical protein